VLVGTNINKNKILIKEVKKLKLSKHVKLIGPMKNISIVMTLLDIHIQSSKSEGFPNVLAESMAHKTPCIATNVGDSSYIIGKTGWLVSPNNSIELAKVIEIAFKEIGTKNWTKKCNMAKERIMKKLNIKNIIKNYNKIWIKVYKKNDR